MSIRFEKLLAKEQGKVSDALIEAFRLGYKQARSHALDAAHEVVIDEIKRGGLFQGKSRAAERVQMAIYDALSRNAP